MRASTQVLQANYLTLALSYLQEPFIAAPTQLKVCLI